MPKVSESATPAIIFSQMKRGLSSENESANSALDMLEAIIDVGLSPDKFAEVCDEWAQNSDNLEEFKHFDNFLDTVYPQDSSSFRPIDSSYFGEIGAVEVKPDPYALLINASFEILSIGDKAANTLGVALGENVSELFNVDSKRILDDVKLDRDPMTVNDIYAVDGSRHVASVEKISSPNQTVDYFSFRLLKIELPIEVETHIRTNLGLTNAEIEILKLILERFSVAAISSLRECTQNTTRTHINNIKKKFKSRSLTDVILSTQEIIALAPQKRNSQFDRPDKYVPVQRNSSVSKMALGTHQVEYSRYGDPSGRALILLHSMEYGVSPPKKFLDEAVSRGYCVYVPLRPGFGRTSPAESTRLSAVILNEFVKTLRLSDITLVSLSTSAPTAIKLMELTNRIYRVSFVNYAFDTKDKIDHIKPVWLKGLLKFGLGSPASFNFAFRMTKRMLRMIGYKSFYGKIYQSCEADLLFVEQNPQAFQAAANLILSAKPECLRNDIISSFRFSPIIDKTVVRQQKVISIFGEHTHGISIAPIRQAAERLNIPFYMLPRAGRNCIYQSPVDFFQIIDLEESLQEKSSA